MSRFANAFLLLLLLLFLSCQKESDSKELANKIVKNQEFSEAYLKTKNKNLDNRTRLNAANLAYSMAKDEQSDSLLILALDRKTIFHNLVKEPDSAILFSKKLLQLVSDNKDSMGIGKSYFKLGLYNEASLAKDSAFYFYNESKKIHELLKDTTQVVKRIRNMAILTSRSGNYIQSNELAIDGLKLLKNRPNDESKGSLINCIAINGRNLKQYDESLYLYEQAVESTTNTKYKNIYLSNIANIYRDKGEFEKAMRLYEQTIAVPEIADDPKEYARILDNLSYTQWLQGNKDASLPGLKKALTLREEAHNYAGQISSHDHLTQYYIENDRTLAIQHAKKMYQLAVRINNPQDQLEALRLLMKVDANQPNQHISYFNQFLTLSDSLEFNKNILGSKFAMIKYDASQKRAENEILKTRSVEEQLELEKSKRMNGIYLSLGVISLFVFAFIFLVSRERYQKEKLEEIVLTESRISKKVHDEVANDLYVIMNKLEKTTDDNDNLISDLDEVYSKTRDISREHSALDLDQDFGELVSDLLMSFKNTDVNIITKGLKNIDWNRISPVRKTAVFRVTQELMTNMAKHSKAQIVILTFDKVNRKVLIKYSDDGIGCSIKKNNGLLNAENRITSLGGKFTLQSEINKGFKATLIV